VLFYVVLVLSGSVETQRKVVNFITPSRIFIPGSIGTKSVKIHQEFDVGAMVQNEVA